MNEWMNTCRKAKAIKERPMGWEWKDWGTDEFSEKELVERRSGGHTLRGVAGEKAARWGRPDEYASRTFLLLPPLKGLPEYMCVTVTSATVSRLFHSKSWETYCIKTYCIFTCHYPCVFEDMQQTLTRGKPYSFFFWSLQNKLSWPRLCQKIHKREDPAPSKCSVHQEITKMINFSYSIK